MDEKSRIIEELLDTKISKETVDEFTDNRGGDDE